MTYERTGYLAHKFYEEQSCRYERMPEGALSDEAFQAWVPGFLSGRTPEQAEEEEIRRSLDLYRELLRRAEENHEAETDPVKRRHLKHDVDFNERWFNCYRRKLDDLLYRNQTRRVAQAAE